MGGFKRWFKRDIIPGTEVLQATDDLVGNNVETFDLSQNTNQYSQYRLFWISGGQIQWDPYIDEITFTRALASLMRKTMTTMAFQTI